MSLFKKFRHFLAEPSAKSTTAETAPETSVVTVAAVSAVVSVASMMPWFRLGRRRREEDGGNGDLGPIL